MAEGTINELDFHVALVTVTVMFINYLVISIVIVIKQRKQLLKRACDKIRAIRKNLNENIENDRKPEKKDMELKNLRFAHNDDSD